MVDGKGRREKKECTGYSTRLNIKAWNHRDGDEVSEKCVCERERKRERERERERRGERGEGERERRRKEGDRREGERDRDKWIVWGNGHWKGTLW